MRFPDPADTHQQSSNYSQNIDHQHSLDPVGHSEKRWQIRGKTRGRPCRGVTNLPLRSPTYPTKKEDSTPPMEKIATDSDQYMVTSGCFPGSSSSASVLLPD